MSSIVTKDSYKADIFNFDMECWKQEDCFASGFESGMEFSKQQNIGEDN